MSRNYDNWERLVAAVLKREQIRQLCHQDSISTISSDSDSVSTIFSADHNFDITHGFNLVRLLGEGEFAATYLAQLSQQYSCGTGSRGVIKWVKKVDLTKTEFKKQMTALRNCRHQNVTTPRASYYSKMRKLILIVYDYFPQGSVFDMLKPGKDSILNWERRVKIAVGTARGTAHIHAQSLIHGNIKSSNVFINRQGYCCVSELGLSSVMKRSFGEKGDVYRFGLLLLELVTGQSPTQAWLVDRLRCFDSKRPVMDEGERFPFVDSCIDISVQSVQQELRNMLQVAKRCLALSPEERPSMSEVVSMLDNTWNKVDESSISQKSTNNMSSDRNKLVVFEDCNLDTDLEDLLRASAKLLGEGTFGTTYKAVLEDDTTIAVKRLKEVIVGRRDFEQQMEVLGNIWHENVAPLRAYYYSKNEKLMVYDFYNQESVSVLLHGKRRKKNMVQLDWETRLKIGIGVARGIAHIHTKCGGKLVHGNIKSSNIFLNSQQYGCLRDLGLATLMSPVSAPVVRSGYQAPEISDTKKASQSSDVYSYGVFLLELLTGKSPLNALVIGDEAIHLVRWVNLVVHEGWSDEVFDVELLRHENVEEEMVTMLHIGLSCVVNIPEQRPKMKEVVKMVEEIIVVGGTKSQGSTPDVNEIGSSLVPN